MDRFKKYLEDNADALDTDVPAYQLWERIEKGTTKKRIARRIFFRYAAAACLLALAVTIIYQLFTNNKPVAPSVVFDNKVPDTSIINRSRDSGTRQAVPGVAVTHDSNEEKYMDKKSAAKIKAPVVDISYELLIKERVKKLGSIPVLAASQSYFQVFTIQLKRMETDEKKIKAQIISEGYSDELMDQLVEVYQQKLNLLKRFQLEIQKINNRVNQQRPVDSSSKPFYIQL